MVGVVLEVVAVIEGVAGAISEVGEEIVVAVVTEVGVGVMETVAVAAEVEVGLHQGNREGELSAR